MATSQEPDFLSLETQPFQPGNDSESSPFDTLWTEFARSHPRLSPPHSPAASVSQHRQGTKAQDTDQESQIDLRSLEYIHEYDTNLQCPICLIPYINPIELACGHTFCCTCWEEYKVGSAGGDRLICPSCRTFHLGSSRKASRLIKNMCDDVRVRCPNIGCEIEMARGCVERHALKECPHTSLLCPDPACEQRTKRRNYVQEQCVHSLRAECDCGAVIELGRGEWIRHKDSECPLTGSNCKRCNKRLHEQGALSEHRCEEGSDEPTCPGAEFGCTEEIPHEGAESHIKTCSLARLALALKKQSLLLNTFQEQLTMTKLQNDVLENGFDRLNEIVTTQLQPKLDTIINNREVEDDIEEIERDHIPSSLNRRDLLLPAHVRSITPSPDLFGSPNSQTHHLYTHQQVHTLHSDLTSQIRHLTNSLDALSSSISDIDARQSMHLMNETLRIREDMAQQGAALYSMRTQVQWLLNRERIVAQQAMGVYGVGMRGRPGWPNQMHASSSNVNDSQQMRQQQNGNSSSTTLPDNGERQADSTSQQAPNTNVDSNPTPTSSTGPSPNLMPTDVNAGRRPSWMPMPATASSSTSTSPMFSSARPPVRRQSGGSSQERVKL